VRFARAEQLWGKPARFCGSRFKQNIWIVVLYSLHCIPKTLTHVFFYISLENGKYWTKFSPTSWPNPVNYKIWSIMQETVYSNYRYNIQDVDELRERIVE